MGLVGDGAGEVGRGHPTRHLGSHIKELKHYSEGYGHRWFDFRKIILVAAWSVLEWRVIQGGDRCCYFSEK